MLQKILQGAFVVRDKVKVMRERIAAKQALKRAERVKSQIIRLHDYKDIYHPCVGSALDELLVDRGDAFRMADDFVMSSKYSDMISSLAKHRKYINDDASSIGSPHRFFVYAFQLIDNLDRSMDSTLAQIANQYKVSASSNALLAGALVATRRGGMAALAAAEGVQAKYQAGAHNADADSVFSAGMKMMCFSVSTSDLSDDYSYFVRTADRFRHFGVGDSKVSNRALFSLIYHANCRYEAPDINSNLVKYLRQEFEDHFSRFIWSPNEAVSHLRKLSETDERCRQLASTSDLRAYTRQYYTYKKFLPESK